jgi:mannitol-1-/sugar-/sorbitol-6-/2-deoxyglucose-6-phosphatase
VKIQAVIFDMDGILIDSEPFWQASEKEEFRKLGISLTTEDCQLTTGMRIQDVAAQWYGKVPWSGPSPDEVADAILQGVIRRVQRTGQALPGACECIPMIRALGLKTAIATSSAPVLITAVLERLNLMQAFDFLVSAETEPYGKPHPGIFLSTARALGIPPSYCLVVEDSIHGVIAAKAARMACVAVPGANIRTDPRFIVADATLDSLHQLTPALIVKLENDMR